MITTLKPWKTDRQRHNLNIIVINNTESTFSNQSLSTSLVIAQEFNLKRGIISSQSMGIFQDYWYILPDGFPEIVFYLPLHC